MIPSKSHSELCAGKYETLLQAIHQQTAIPSKQLTPGATRTPGSAMATTQTLSHLSSTLLHLEVKRTLQIFLQAEPGRSNRKHRNCFPANPILFIHGDNGGHWVCFKQPPRDSSEEHHETRMRSRVSLANAAASSFLLTRAHVLRYKGYKERGRGHEVTFRALSGDTLLRGKMAA